LRATIATMNRRERRAAAAQRAEYEIDTVSAYFRNDTTTGIAISLKFEDGAKGRRFAEGCEKAMLHFDMSPPGPAIAWLTKIGRERPPLTKQLCNWIVGTIHWLERRHYIQSDEYNGVMWMGVRGDEFFAIRGDQPSSANLRDLVQHRVELDPLKDTDFEQKLREILGSPPSN
jgi:hypothetical protein